MEQDRKNRPLQAKVVSDKCSKTRVATIERRTKHPVFEKYVVSTTRVMFHDENNESKLGDTVLISPSRPMSARKRFRLVKILGSRQVLEVTV